MRVRLGVGTNDVLAIRLAITSHGICRADGLSPLVGDNRVGGIAVDDTLGPPGNDFTATARRAAIVSCS